MKRARRTKPKPRATWKKAWEPIFRAAREGRLPNRMKGVLEVQAMLCALRKARLFGRYYDWSS
ncbi:MAG: hypothetical protein FJ388_17735 [Verrucomicrobia bacterium]|nr:hypothetical protein [Verrucomicrobiota bacterium]